MALKVYQHVAPIAPSAFQAPAVCEVLQACDELGGISAEYFCEEFVFVTEDPDDIPRLHDDNYLKINWGLN